MTMLNDNNFRNNFKPKCDFVTIDSSNPVRKVFESDSGGGSRRKVRPRQRIMGKVLIFRVFVNFLTLLKIVFYTHFHWKKGYTLVIRGSSKRNIQDRYRHVYILLIRKQKQNFLANVRLSVRPQNFCILKLENG